MAPGNSVADTDHCSVRAQLHEYCNGCHSLQYMRYQRMADDMQMPTSVLTRTWWLRSTNLDYISTSMPAPMPPTGSARRRRICR